MKKVVIAMSGGVDSSVAAALLKEQGYECIGMHVSMYEDDPESGGLCSTGGAKARNKCCNLDGLEDARWVCEKLGIPFYVMNAESQFKEKVVEYFLDAYGRGETPNPCVECNRHIKFGDLLRRAGELGADFLATGHYARMQRNDETGEHELLMARSKAKDQSYFLYTLTKEKLARVLFPIGDFEKSQVYEMARERGLVRQVEKPQSQGLCFFAEGNPRDFLLRYLAPAQRRPGPIVAESGRVLGKHRGLPFYTIGQRQGLGIGGISGEPEGQAWYVKRIERDTNTIVVGRVAEVGQRFLFCDRASFVSGKIPKGTMEVSVRIRHRGALVPSIIRMEGDRVIVEASGGEVHFSAPAAGQSAVFYDGEKVIGGAVIHAYEKTPEREEVRVHTAH